MLLSFAYFAFGAILRLLVGGRRGEFDKDIELIVLRVGCTNSIFMPRLRIRGASRRGGRAA